MLESWSERSDLLLTALATAGIDAGAWLRAAARLAPSALLVPGLGLRALPAPTRVAITLALVTAASVPAPAPAAQPLAAADASALLLEGLAGTPLALAAAGALWVSSQVGDLADWSGSRYNLRPHAGLGLSATPLGALLGLGATTGFLALGGPARLASAAMSGAPGGWSWLVGELAAGLELAVHLAAPLLATLLLVALVAGLLSRWGALSNLAPIGRALTITALTGLLLSALQERAREHLDSTLPALKAPR